mmetsp:Transcript_108675/g.325052  ORF Transcript_108675/g.325052 Transcript_108675/m.325052 type:complete len:260 (-) Transcript_108675:86-865(-)
MAAAPRCTVRALPRTFGPAPWLDGRSGARFAACGRSERQQVQRVWAAADAELSDITADFLKVHLRAFWRRHREAIRTRGKGVNKNRSAYDVHRCWPSSTWFREGPLPVKDKINFEFGDSSYSVWVFDRAVATPLLGRILCDLYLREVWPEPSKAGPWAQADSDEAFAALAMDAMGDGWPGQWEFQLRPVPEIMRKIWWRPEYFFGMPPHRRRFDVEERMRVVERRPWFANGPFVPIRPAPSMGFILRWGQQSIFFTWVD